LLLRTFSAAGRSSTVFRVSPLVASSGAIPPVGNRLVGQVSGSGNVTATIKITGKNFLSGAIPGLGSVSGVIFNAPHGASALTGNVIGSGALSASITNTPTVAWNSNVNMVVDGNSFINPSEGSTGGQTLSNQLQALPPFAGSGATATTLGHSGFSWSQLDGAASTVDAAFVPGKINILVVGETTNTVFNTGADAATTITQTKAYVANRLAAHPWDRIVLFGTIPRQSGGSVAAQNAILTAVDADMKNNTSAYGAYHFVDVRAGTIYAFPDYTDASFTAARAYYYDTPMIHPTNAGYGILAKALSDYLRTMPLPTASNAMSGSVAGIGAVSGTMTNSGGVTANYIRLTPTRMTESVNGAGGYNYAANNDGGYDTNYTVGQTTRFLPAGQDGWFQIVSQGQGNNGPILALSVNPNPVRYQDSAVGAYMDSNFNSSGYNYILSGGGSVGSANNTGTVQVGDLLRLRRTGSSIVAETSKNAGATWVNVYSFSGTYTGALYPIFQTGTTNSYGVIVQPSASSNVA